MQELTDFPATLSAGETLKFRYSNSDFPANGGWAMTVHLKGKSALNVSGSPKITTDGADFVVDIPASDTAALLPGRYTWLRRFTHATEGVFDEKGSILITPDIAAATAGALQSHAEKMLAALQAVELGSATREQQTVQIDGIAIAYMEPLDRLKWINHYQAIVNSERRGGALKVTPLTFRRFR